MSEQFRAEVASAASAHELLRLTRRALAETPLTEREAIRQLVARHGRHWDLRLASYLSTIPPWTEVQVNQTMFLVGQLGEAVDCVEHMQPVYSFITGMVERSWRGRMKALVTKFRLSAVTWPGRAIFAVALDQQGLRSDRAGRAPVDEPGTRPLVAHAWLLEFEDVPDAWQEELAPLATRTVAERPQSRGTVEGQDSGVLAHRLDRC